MSKKKQDAISFEWKQKIQGYQHQTVKLKCAH